jgi:hypothetical protein
MTSFRVLLVLLLAWLGGCDTNSVPGATSEQRDNKQERLGELNRQKADALYELELRQDEMKEMEATSKKPGVVGVTNGWLERHNQLKEEVIKLKVKIHDLEIQIEAASRP